jgi:hypothetical protein
MNRLPRRRRQLSLRKTSDRSNRKGTPCPGSSREGKVNKNKIPPDNRKGSMVLIWEID